MSVILDYKCPNCGGAIKFNAENQSFQCESCDSVFTEEQLRQYSDILNAASEQSAYDWQPTNGNETLDGMKSYSCQSCGAQIAVDETTSASRCPYCDSPVVLAEQLSGINKPDCVIPFKLGKNEAAAALKSFYKGKFLLPKIFKDENKIKEMQGIYVPFWLFSCTAKANILYDATRVRTWSDSSYNYTETSYYNIFRAGSLSFANVPADGSTKMDDAYMEGIEPFNYAEMTDFNPAYLSGFLADKYDVDAQTSFPRVEKRVDTSTTSAFADTVTGYSTVVPKSTSINAGGGSYRYALLPVWMLTSKWNDKVFSFAINGQTGRVSGELPIDRKKFWLLFGGIAAAILAVGQFFVF